MLVAGCGGDDEATDSGAITESSTTTSDSTTVTSDAVDVDDAEDAGDDGSDGDTEELFPDVLDATAEPDGSGTWTFSATHRHIEPGCHTGS